MEEKANEAGADRSNRVFGVKNVDVETAPSTESKISKSSQSSDHKSQGSVSNVLVDIPRVNKGAALRDNGSLSRVVASRLPFMRRSASSDAILSSYLYGRWPRLDAFNADYYMKLQPKVVHEVRLQPHTSADTIGANSVMDQEALEDTSARTCRALSYFVPATKSASWTECACFFDDTITAVINNQDCSGNESILPSPLEIDDLCNQCASEVEGHRAPLADLLNQLSTSTDCCRALHFVTISDSDDNSSDSDASNDNPALFVDYATAAVISSPPVNISPPVEPTSGSVVRGVSPMEQHRVRSSHGLFDDIDGSSTTISPPPRTEHGSTIPPCAAGTQGQHICTDAKHNVIAVKSICRPAPEGCESKASVLEQQYKVTSLIPSQQSAFVRPRYSAPTPLSC